VDLGAFAFEVDDAPTAGRAPVPGDATGRAPAGADVTEPLE